MELFQVDRNLPFPCISRRMRNFPGTATSTWSWTIAARAIVSLRSTGESWRCRSGDFVIIHTMEDHTIIGSDLLLGVQMDLSVLDTAFSPFYESQYLVPFIRETADTSVDPHAQGFAAGEHFI